MKEIGILEAKTHLSALLNEVEDGVEIVITRHGKPVARLVSASVRSRPGPEIADSFREVRDRIAAEWQASEPFDWKAAVEVGRP